MFRTLKAKSFIMPIDNEALKLANLRACHYIKKPNDPKILFSTDGFLLVDNNMNPQSPLMSKEELRNYIQNYLTNNPQGIHYQEQAHEIIKEDTKSTKLMESINQLTSDPDYQNESIYKREVIEFCTTLVSFYQSTSRLSHYQKMTSLPDFLDSHLFSIDDLFDLIITHINDKPFKEFYRPSTNNYNGTIIINNATNHLDTMLRSFNQNTLNK